MRRSGSKVTMIDRNVRLMSKEDPDVCEALRSSQMKASTFS
jgi:pyruvate/2-oxoglutarate dehydrogenase complex dihydrolipoamide dehydrogenase (E3) component